VAPQQGERGTGVAPSGACLPDRRPEAQSRSDKRKSRLTAGHGTIVRAPSNPRTLPAHMFTSGNFSSYATCRKPFSQRREPAPWGEAIIHFVEAAGREAHRCRPVVVLMGRMIRVEEKGGSAGGGDPDVEAQRHLTGVSWNAPNERRAEAFLSKGRSGSKSSRSNFAPLMWAGHHRRGSSFQSTRVTRKGRLP